MVIAVSIVASVIVLAILMGLHGKYNKVREENFPVAELEKFNK